MFLVNDVTYHFCVRQNAQHVIRPTFISDEVKLSSTAARKGSWLSVNDKEGHIFLPSMNAVSFSQFSFSLLQGNGNISLSLKCVLFVITVQLLHYVN